MTAEQQMPSPEQLPPVRTDDDLIDRWKLLLREEYYDSRSLWVLWFDPSGVQMPVIVPVDEVPDSPDPEFIDALADVADRILNAEGGWVSLALLRPGSGLICSDDRAWATQLRTSLDSRGVESRPLCLATAGRIRQLVLDDL